MTISLLKPFYRPIKRSKKHFPSFSILIPVYNEENNIKKKITNLYALDYPKDKYEIIVIDDGSTDNTVKILNQFHKLKLLTLRRSGKTSAINAGLDNSTLNVVLITDADCLLEKSALLRAAEALSDDTVGAVTGKTHLKKTKTSIIIKEQSAVWSRLTEKESLLDSIPTGMGGFLAFKRRLITRLDPKSLADDVDISAKIRMKGFRVIYSPSIIVSTWDPDDFKTWYNQTVRRTLQGLTTLYHNKKLLFNPKYGFFGVLIFPTRLLLHRLTPFFLALAFLSSLFINTLFSLSLLISLIVGCVFITRLRKLLIVQIIFLNAWGVFLLGKYNKIWARGPRQNG